MTRVRRVAAATALGLLLGLPVPAQACTVLRGPMQSDRRRVEPGGSVRVSSSEVHGVDPCPMPPPPTQPPTSEPTQPPGTAAPEPSETPSETPSAPPSQEPTATPEETPTTTSPAMTPVAAARPLTAPSPSGGPVVISIARKDPLEYGGVTGTIRPIAQAEATYAPHEGGGTLRSFTATVTIPADVAPGSYRLLAEDRQVYYGWADVIVVESLPATGTHAASLGRLAVLLLVTGAGALAVARVRTRS